MIKFISAEIAFALNTLHANRFVYRDLKPENVMICNDGHICLIDMGLCKYLKKERAMWSSGGTPSYIAPEVLERKHYSYTADWWSFGVLLWEMLTGKPPFMESNRKKLFQQIKNQQLTKPPSMSITISLIVLYEYLRFLNSTHLIYAFVCLTEIPKLEWVQMAFLRSRVTTSMMI